MRYCRRPCKQNNSKRRLLEMQPLQGVWHSTPPRSTPAGMRKAGPRILLIGLDSADADLIERWCQEGYLPTLQSLRQAGIWGRLGTTAEVMHVSAWPSIYTGTTPGKHGMYHAYQI